METNDVDQRWASYLGHERRGDRAAALAELRQLAEALEGNSARRNEWARKFLRQRAAGKGEHIIRTPLLEKVLFPYLEEQYRAGEADAARWLARLYPLLIRCPDCWEAVGRPGAMDLWREVRRRDPGDEESRQALIALVASRIQYTLHELPTGVLFGRDGARREECAVLQEELAEFRGLLRGAEEERYADLIGKADFHYRVYRDYLTDVQGHADYESFFTARGDL